MKTKLFLLAALACFAVGILCPGAGATNHNPASLLLFPMYDTSVQNLTVMTITNVSADPVSVRLVWIDQETCTPEDQWIELTGGDTFTFFDQAMNPEPNEEGFMYAYVVESIGSKIEEDSNVLIGQEYFFNAFPNSLSFGVNAKGFASLNLTKDGDLHLDGVEYDAAPYKLYFPRFFAQFSVVSSNMVLINLTGGQHFWQQADVLVYNDNEQPFSSTVYFPCWDNLELQEVSGATTRASLLSSNHDPLELWDGNNNPLAPHYKTGWLWIESDWVWNPSTSFVHDDPCLYGFLIERTNNNSMGAADLPWQVENPQVNKYGMLWATSPWGEL